MSVNINIVLREFNLTEKWSQIISPTMYNDRIIPFDVSDTGENSGIYKNGTIITMNPNGSINWLSMTIDGGKHVTNFNARFDKDGELIDFDVNYFNFGFAKNVVEEEYISEQIRSLVESIKRNRDEFKII